MAKFIKKGKGELPPISTASLPDIIYMLLFFFMVTTTMKEVEFKVKMITPKATEVKKLEKKSTITYIYVGEPQNQYVRIYGTASKIQLNDQFADKDAIREYISTERDEMSEEDQPYMTTSLKVDQNTKMGIVTDIKQELRKASALKINYSANQVKTLF